MAFYGYYQWNKNDSTLQIEQWTTAKHLLILLIGDYTYFFNGLLLHHYTNAAMPLVDSFTTVFSVFATYMVTKKVLGNWLYWIVIDAVSVYLYFSRGLTPYLHPLYCLYCYCNFWIFLHGLKRKMNCLKLL